MRVVLDSNVWVDWLVFDDPAIAPLKAASRDGRIEIAIDAACMDELVAVLAYPEFELDAQRQATAIAQARRIAIACAEPQADSTVPRCTDSDDQKFIDLARAIDASWLITRDKALLKLDRRLARYGLRVAQPATWTEASRVPA